MSYPAINAGDLMLLLAPLPTPDEQSAISALLDRETAKIDALIAEQRRLIELLKEKRQAVISHAVTKGLNPDARMKDSGIEWLGEVPEHWEIRKLTKCVSSVVDYRGKTPTKVADGVFLVTKRNIKDGAIDYEISQEFVSAHEYDDIIRRGKPNIGDLVVTMEAPLGQVANIDRTGVTIAQRIIKNAWPRQRIVELLPEILVYVHIQSESVDIFGNWFHGSWTES